MGNDDGQVTYYDVVQTSMVGRLDETTASAMKSDLAIIRTYIRAEKEAASSAPGRTLPSVAREVLTSVWESPRIGFSHDATIGFQRLKFYKKLLLIPWSVEAFEQAQSTKSVTGLVLEHVTPIQAMWQKLKELDVDWGNADAALPDGEWETVAAGYLVNHYMLAVLTKDQATAIDAVPGLRQTGFEGNPFLRYQHAENVMDEIRTQGNATPPFSVKRFVIPGPSIAAPL